MGGLQNRDMALRLAAGGAELNRHLRDEFTRAADRAADETRVRILGATSLHPGTLRAEIAASVSVRTLNGTYGVQAEIKSSGTRMPGRPTLAAYANARGRWTRWRHPVFQSERNPDPPWVTQEWPSAQGWFDDPIQASARSFTNAAETALEETSVFLEGRG